MARATVSDIHEIARSMPGAERAPGDAVVYQVRGKSFVFFRSPRPDAFDPHTGERYDDVVVFWVESEEQKEALVADPTTPFFTTPHFRGHRSVLLRHSRVGELLREELAEVVYDAWLARAPKRLARQWLAEHHLEDTL
jgi:hypothetical protein